jgi:hypothetical protein
LYTENKEIDFKGQFIFAIYEAGFGGFGGIERLKNAVVKPLWEILWIFQACRVCFSAPIFF